MFNVHSDAPKFHYQNKRQGESGSPCLITLLLLKIPAGEPFNIIEKVGVARHSLIQIIHLKGKPMQ